MHAFLHITVKAKNVLFNKLHSFNNINVSLNINTSNLADTKIFYI